MSKSNVNILNRIDYRLTKGVYNFFNRNIIRQIPHLFGLIPYEIYVVPGMYVAILLVVWFGSPNPVQFHLLPHWFAYSVFQFLKKTIKRGRPGCMHKDLSKFIEASHCKGGHEYQSFPSGHTGVSFALATALFMEMFYADIPHFFEITIKNPIAQKFIGCISIFVAVMVGLHRISKGYHSVFDVIIL